jgi:hypothetical protein
LYPEQLDEEFKSNLTLCFGSLGFENFTAQSQIKKTEKTLWMKTKAELLSTLQQTKD